MLQIIFFKEKDALVIAHEKNFEKMDKDKKSLLSFIITLDGYLRVNFNGERILYVGASSNLHKNFRKNFLSKCAKPVAWALASSMNNLEKDLGRLPFKGVYRIESYRHLIETITGSLKMLLK